MADSLTTLISKLQALLLDDGTYFSTATCTAAVRHALRRVNADLPVHAATTIDVVSGQYEYELTAAAAGADPIAIIDVLLADPSGGEYDQSLTFDPYSEDERYFFRLEAPQQSGTLIVRFTQAHTINGLDSATESTLSAMADVTLLDAAAAQANYIAAAGKVQTNNLDPSVPENYRKAAASFERAYNVGITNLQMLRRIQKSVKDTRAWNDKWHDWPALN